MVEERSSKKQQGGEALHRAESYPTNISAANSQHETVDCGAETLADPHQPNFLTREKARKKRKRKKKLMMLTNTRQRMKQHMTMKRRREDERKGSEEGAAGQLPALRGLGRRWAAADPRPAGSQRSRCGRSPPACAERRGNAGERGGGRGGRTAQRRGGDRRGRDSDSLPAAAESALSVCQRGRRQSGTARTPRRAKRERKESSLPLQPRIPRLLLLELLRAWEKRQRRQHTMRKSQTEIAQTECICVGRAERRRARQF